MRNDFLKKPGKQIKKIRNDKNKMQLDVLGKAEMGENAFQRIKIRHTNPIVKTLLKITNVFEITLSKLFDFMKVN